MAELLEASDSNINGKLTILDRPQPGNCGFPAAGGKKETV
jgi:hypothetical protein